MKVLVVDDAVLPWGSTFPTGFGYRGFFHSGLLRGYDGSAGAVWSFSLDHKGFEVTWVATLEEFEWEMENGGEYDRIVVDLSFPMSMTGAVEAGDGEPQRLSLEIVWETKQSAEAISSLIYAARPLAVAREIGDGVRMDPEKGRKCNGVLAVQELARRDLLNITTVFTSDIPHARSALCVLLTQKWLPAGEVGEVWRSKQEFEQRTGWSDNFFCLTADRRLAVGPKTGDNFRALLGAFGFPIDK